MVLRSISLFAWYHLGRLESVLGKGFKCGINLNKGTDLKNIYTCHVLWFNKREKNLSLKNMEQIKYVLREIYSAYIQG